MGTIASICQAEHTSDGLRSFILGSESLCGTHELPPFRNSTRVGQNHGVDGTAVTNNE